MLLAPRLAYSACGAPSPAAGVVRTVAFWRCTAVLRREATLLDCLVPACATRDHCGTVATHAAPRDAGLERVLVCVGRGVGGGFRKARWWGGGGLGGAVAGVGGGGCRAPPNSWVCGPGVIRRFKTPLAPVKGWVSSATPLRQLRQLLSSSRRTMRRRLETRSHNRRPCAANSMRPLGAISRTRGRPETQLCGTTGCEVYSAPEVKKS